MVGSVYYAAVTALKKYVAENTYEDLPEEKQFTFGVVFLTTVTHGQRAILQIPTMNGAYVHIWSTRIRMVNIQFTAIWSRQN